MFPPIKLAVKVLAKNEQHLKILFEDREHEIDWADVLEHPKDIEEGEDQELVFDGNWFSSILFLEEEE